MHLVVSVIVPVLNEERYIIKFIDSFLKQDFDKNKMEIIFIDGHSSDRTKEIISSHLKRFEFIKIFDNPKKTLASGANIGIKNAIGDYIIRMDAHVWYAPDYISKCIEFIKKTGSQNVGGPTIARGENRIQKIIAAAYHSSFALGGGKNHDENYEGLVDTVAWGTFDRKYLNNIGLYDEKMCQCEDDDLNFRIYENGGKIFMTPKIKSIYYPRDNLKSLFLQYFKYGISRVAVIKKHKKLSRISRIIPALFVAFLISFSIISIFNKFIFLFFFFILTLYVSVTILYSFRNKMLFNFSDKCILILTHLIIHFSYGFGFLYGLFKFWNVKFKKETLNYELSRDVLRQLQLKSLDLLIRFKKFCIRNGLEFFLCGGGCIGSIRNGGFIPWDDDLDIFMTRENYELLFKIFKNSEEDFYLIRTTDEHFSGQIFTTIVDKKSTLIKKEQIGIKLPRGVAIDLFPLDACPNGFFKQKIQMLNAYLFSLYTARIIPKNHGKIIELFGKILLKIVPNNYLRFKIAKICERNMSKYNLSNCKYIKELCAGPGYMKNKYEKEIFESHVLKSFEGHLVPVPVGYDRYLRIAFGEYLDLPSEEEQKNSHHIIFLDLKNPSEKYNHMFL
ncbi:MAG: LicD family protein [Firmicutes bacterium]|nr:LicD family protein [Bacillota bacterium]